MSRSKSKRILAPLSQEAVEGLRAGDECLISGELLVARDQAHKLLCEILQKGRRPPVNLAGAVIFYAGPTPARPGRVSGSVGPTTSGRMDKFTPALLGAGVKGMIGKGQRSDEVKKALIAHRAVYFAAIGGAAALLAGCIVSSTVVYGEKLGAEAVRLFVVRDMPVIVVNDIYGGDAYEEGMMRFRVG